ncbi:hypothetical protein Tco_0367099 [Tanacetum coccineum]
MNTINDLRVLYLGSYTMADAEHAPTMAPPVCTDEQIYLDRWVPIGAFTASSTITAIYIQQFWDTICFDSKAGSYKCQLDDQWFDLTQDTLIDALRITPVDKNRVFSPPPTPNTLIKFVNELGYPREVINLSNVTTNDMFQPWRALATIINLCLTGKTSGFERPRAPVLHILWGVVNRAHIDYGERMWEEFTQEERKPVSESSDAPPLAKRAKAGKVVKKRTAKSSKQLVDEFIDEGVPTAKPSLEDTEEAILQKVLEESLTDAYPTLRGPLPPVVFREHNTGKLQPLPERGKRKHTPVPSEPAGHEESSSLYAELGLYGSDTEYDEEMPSMKNLKLPNEGEVRLEEPASSAGTLSSLQNLDKELSFADQFLVEKSQEDEPEKTNTESEVQSLVTIPIHQDTSSVPLMTTPVIDLTVSQPVSTTIQAPLPTSTATVTAITTTTTSLPPIPPQPQQGSSDSILIQRIGELEQHMADMVEANQALEERLDKQGNRLYNLENLDIPHKVSKAVDEIVTDAVDWAIQAPLRDRFRDLPEADMKEILHHRMWESNSYQAHEDHKMLYEALEKSMARDHTDQLLTDLAEARRKKKKRHTSPKTPPGSPPHQPPTPSPPAGSSGTPGASGSSQLPPPPLPLSTNQSDQSTSTAALSSLKTAVSVEYTAWTNTDTTLKSSVSSIPEELHMDDDTTPNEQVQSSGDEDIRHDHIPMVNLRQNWWKPLTKDRPATLEPAWSIPSSDLPVPVNNWASALASTYAPPLENSLLA